MNICRKNVQKGKILLFFILFGLLLLLADTKVYANDSNNQTGSEFDYSEIQGVIDNIMSSNDKMNFEDYVMNLLTEKKNFSIKQIGNDIKNGITNEVKDNVGTLKGLLSIIIIAAVFTNFSYAFKDNQVAETGFYVAYLLLFSVLTASFVSVAHLAADTVSAVLSFMKVLIPSYFLSVAFCTSASTSMVYYEATLFMISFADLLLIKLVIPMINVYIILSMANNLSKEDLLSKLTDLISVTIKWILKSMLAIVIGFNTIQGLILPVADKVKKSALLKAAGIIPGFGDMFGSITESVLGAGILLKNAIGIAGVVVIISVCAVPIIKLAVTTIIYKVSCAVVQPIADKRMLNCVSATAEAAGLLLQTICMGAFLFLLTITIIAATTS